MILFVCRKKTPHDVMNGGEQMNKQELKAVMVRHGDNGGDLAEHLGINRSTFSAKLNENGAEFTQSEIAKIKERYNLTAAEIVAIFFSSEVSE